MLKVILSLESGSKIKSQKPPHVRVQQTLPSIQITPLPALQGSADLVVEKALVIIAEESGLSVSDLTDATIFSDVGVDSLLGLTISARFKEELDMDLDFNALFYEHPTVGHLKVSLASSRGDATGVSTPGWSGSEAVTTAATTGVTTPDLSGHSRTPSPPVDFSRALQIIAEESGIAVEELGDDTNFADTGVDSLLSLVLVSRFRDELDLDMQHETLFLECPTVADLKRFLVGGKDGGDSHIENLPAQKIPLTEVNLPKAKDAIDSHKLPESELMKASESTPAELTARKEAVDACIRKYTSGFSAPTFSPSAVAPSDKEKVILVTGASGSLGGNLVYHLAQLPDVKTVVCLNRENKGEPYDRQEKAMRSKGIRFPPALKHKLLVFQTDTSKPNLGLTSSDYSALVGSVTHIIHNAWPMSAKRAFAGFESQFQVLRNLIDLAAAASSQRPSSFKFTFQLVSSIGVVGHYGLGTSTATTTTLVPEARAAIDGVLPNGYSDAKWGCENMLDQTLHTSNRFRTMAVRLGQIAGSKTSGYWNPMEHFGFLVKSSQTLNALPDVNGRAYWTPVNDVAAALSDLVLSESASHPIYHVENPVGQPWTHINEVLSDALGIKTLIPFAEWVERVRAAPLHDNPAGTLLEFLDSNYLRMSCGGLVLDVRNSVADSESLARVGEVSEEVIRKYIHVWKEIGFLK